MEEAGYERRWASRDRETGCLCVCHPTNNAQPVDPMLLVFAQGYDNLYGDEGSANSHPLEFVVLANTDRAQIVARFGSARSSMAVPPSADGYALARALNSLFARYRQEQLI